MSNKKIQILLSTYNGEKFLREQLDSYLNLENYGDILTMEQSILMGMSGGGTATYYAACFEKRFDVYLPGASLCSFKDSIIELCHCSCNYVPKIAEYFALKKYANLNQYYIQ